MIYTLTLNPALDYDIYLESVELGKLNEVNNNKYRIGGKGINVSILLNNLGIKNVALGFTGGFVGNYIKSELNSMGIEHDFIEIEDNNRINIKINDESNETEITGLSPNIKKEKIDELFKKIEKLNEEDYLVLSGSINKGLSKEIYKEISKKTKAKVILDTRGEYLLDNIFNNYLIKPNIKELEDVFGKSIKTDEEIYNLCKVFFEKNVKYILVSKGSKGATLLSKDGYVSLGIPEGEYINSIGAGDSTVGGFIAASLEGLSDEDKLKFAIACGSATAYSYEIAKKNEIYNLLNKIK